MARLLPGLFQEGVDLICGGPLLRILVPTLSDHAPQLGVAVLDHRPRLLAVQELLEHDLWVQAHLRAPHEFPRRNYGEFTKRWSPPR